VQEQRVVAPMRVVCVRKFVGDGSSGPGGGWEGNVRVTRSMWYRKVVASFEWGVLVCRYVGSVANGECALCLYACECLAEELLRDWCGI